MAGHRDGVGEQLVFLVQQPGVRADLVQRQVAGCSAAGVGGASEPVAVGGQRRAGDWVDGGGGATAGPAGAAAGVVDRLGQRGLGVVQTGPGGLDRGLRGRFRRVGHRPGRVVEGVGVAVQGV